MAGEAPQAYVARKLTSKWYPQPQHVTYDGRFEVYTILRQRKPNIASWSPSAPQNDVTQAVSWKSEMMNEPNILIDRSSISRLSLAQHSSGCVRYPSEKLVLSEHDAFRSFAVQVWGPLGAHVGPMLGLTRALKPS